ncbi:hypothetical protein HQQ81_20140 [Microbacteriaceae bacterium VKM Ac-2854]|nr:hypothetical protein [Microbacteriaceae bacterium VKM Ac-2854]
MNSILEGFGKAVASLGTLWVYVPSAVLIEGENPGRGGGTPPAADAFTTILGYVTWVSLGLCVLSLIVAGAMLASRRRHGDGETHLGRLGVIVLAVMLISAATSIVSALLPSSAPAASNTVGFLQNQLWWYTGALAVLSVILAAARMAWTQRAQPARELFRGLLTLLAVSGAGLTVISLATGAADQFSVWILDNSTDCTVSNGESNCFGTNLYRVISLTASAPASLGLIAVFLLGLIALVLSYVQVALMVVRGGMLVILAGILPLTASFTNTEMGRAWFGRAVGWTLAFVLYKPAAAIIYAAAFRLSGTDLFAGDGTGLLQIVTGLALMLMALVALPALMRFVTPAVSALAQGGAGAGAIALAGAAGSMAGEIAQGAIRASNAHSGGGSAAAMPTGGSGGAGAMLRPSSSGAAAGGRAAASAAGPSGGATGAGAAAGGSAAGAAAASGAAASGALAAAGPVGLGIAAAQKVGESASKAAATVKSLADEATGS